jgi:hypothetical protein
MKKHWLVPLITSLLLAACGGGTPERLAADMQKALQSGDLDAALELADLNGAPPEILFFYADMVPDCQSGDTCIVSLGPYSAERAEQDRASAAEQGFEIAHTPLGVLVVSSQSKDAAGESSSKLQMPYAKVDGKYKVIVGSYSQAKLAELRATPTDALVDKMLAGGIYDNATQARRTDWKEIASVLPVGGGEVGAWFKQRTEAVHKAAKTGDPEAVIKAGGSWEAMLYRDKEYDGSPVSKERRQLKLRAQTLRSLASVNVLGGYQYGSDTLLIIEGISDNGWVVRGPILISGEGEDLGVSGRGTISYPPS